MKKLMLVPLAFVLFSVISGCTTERASQPPQTVIYQDKQPGGVDTREAAREGAREGSRDPYR